MPRTPCWCSLIQIAVGQIRGRDDDGAKRHAERGAEFELASIVRAVDAGLDPNDARNTEHCVELAHGLHVGFRRGVVAIIDVRILRRGPEHMHMAVGRVRRHCEGRRSWIGFGRQAELDHRDFSICFAEDGERRG